MVSAHLTLWLSRRIPSLSIVVLLLLFYLALYNDPGSSAKHQFSAGNAEPHQRYFQHDLGAAPDRGHPSAQNDMNLWRLIFLVYFVLVHCLALVFPVRASWAIWHLARALKKVEPIWQPRVSEEHNVPTPALSPTASTRSSSPGASILSEKNEVVYSTENQIPEKGPIHAVILPNYREDFEIVQETLQVLACHPQAMSHYDIYLAMEQRESGSLAKALQLISEFSGAFRRIKYTMHPCDIPGESAGKSSNLAWAAKEACMGYSIHLSRDQRKNVIVTVMDSDSHLSATHFSLISAMHIAYPETALTTCYVPPNVFDRNSTSVPTMVRIADTLWSAAGISGLYDGSAIRPPTSVYSLPLALVDLVGGWDAGPDAIGEDLHMYIKCFFALGGNLTTRTVLSAVSQTNVSSDEKGIRGYFTGHRARYKQAIRHMWGSLDTGYAFRRLLSLCWNGLPIEYGSPRLSPHVDTFQHVPFRPSSHPPRRCSSTTPINPPQTTNWPRVFILFHRLFEAHFLPTHLVTLIVASALYTSFTPQSNIPAPLLLAFDICAYLRIAGFGSMCFMLSLYDGFYDLCVGRREDEMERAGLAAQMKGSFPRRTLPVKVLDRLLFPVAGMLFGTLPALHAQGRLLWTVHLVYSVSRKPMRVVMAPLVKGLELV